jgi:hypothetical protein
MAAETALTPPSVIYAEIENRANHVYEGAGYVTPEGERDPQAMHDAAYKVVRKCVATSKEDKAEKAITKGELYAAVFPNGPGADGTDEQELDEYDRAVFRQLERDVWSLMQAKAGGSVQKRLGEEGSPLILCQAKIRRNLNPAPAVYLTENPTLIMEDCVDKEVKAFERKAENLRKELEMVMGRQPELAARIMGRLGQGISRTQAELSFPDSQLELEAGS